MYAKGMTTSDIQAHIKDIYGMNISDTTVSRITDKILPEAREWQQRPLESVYAVVFMDAIHYHVRSEGQIVKKAVYIAIGVNLEGRKSVLGMWVGENESAKFWASVLNNLKNRKVEDIPIGNLLCVHVHAANIHDTKGGVFTFEKALYRYPTIIAARADQGYTTVKKSSSFEP